MSGTAIERRDGFDPSKRQFLVAAGVGGAALGVSTYLAFRRLENSYTAPLRSFLTEAALANIPHIQILEGLDRLRVRDGIVRQDTDDQGRPIDAFCVDLVCNRQDLIEGRHQDEPYSRVALHGLTFDEAFAVSAVIAGERRDDFQDILDAGTAAMPLLVGTTAAPSRREFIIGSLLVTAGGTIAVAFLARSRIFDTLGERVGRLLATLGDAGDGEPLPPQTLVPPTVTAPRTPVPTVTVFPTSASISADNPTLLPTTAPTATGREDLSTRIAAAPTLPSTPEPSRVPPTATLRPPTPILIPTLTVTPTERPTVRPTINVSEIFDTKYGEPKKIYTLPISTSRISGESWETAGFNTIHTQGGTITVEDDSTYGKVLKLTATQDRGDFRIQLDKVGPVIYAPIRIRLPVYIPETFDFGINGWTFVTAFREIKESDHDYDALAMINLSNASRRITSLTIKEPYSGTNFKRVAGNTPLKIGWNIFELTLDKGGMLTYNLNSITQAQTLSRQAELLKSQGGDLSQFKDQLRQLNAGTLYGKEFKANSFILVGPTTIETW